MTDIRFYHNAPDRLRAAGSIAAKAVQQGRRVVVYAPQAELARRFDELLWSAQPLSFVPHVAANSPLAARTPVVIASRLDNLPHADVLLNLGDGEENHLPDDFSRFQLLIEIVSTDDADRERARARWSAFKRGGHTLNAIDLAKPT